MKNLTAKLLLVFIIMNIPIYSMHIAEGYLPFNYSLLWWVFYLPFLFIGANKIKKYKSNLEKKQFLALVGAFVFVISAIKLPSVTGSSSHATGIALGVIILGMSEMWVLGGIVLLFQAIFLAHGGLTTLGANAISMAVIGSIISYFVYKLTIKITSKNLGIFLAAFIGNLATYSFTSFQLALAHSGGNFIQAFYKFIILFSVTQIPLGIVEGIITVLVVSILPKDIFIESEDVTLGIVD